MVNARDVAPASSPLDQRGWMLYLLPAKPRSPFRFRFGAETVLLEWNRITLSTPLLVYLVPANPHPASGRPSGRPVRPILCGGGRRIPRRATIQEVARSNAPASTSPSLSSSAPAPAAPSAPARRKPGRPPLSAERLEERERARERRRADWHRQKAEQEQRVRVERQQRQAAEAERRAAVEEQQRLWILKEMAERAQREAEVRSQRAEQRAAAAEQQLFEERHALRQQELELLKYLRRVEAETGQPLPEQQLPTRVRDALHALRRQEAASRQLRFEAAWALWRQGADWERIRDEVGFGSTQAARRCVMEGLQAERGIERVLKHRLYEARLEDWLLALRPQIASGNISAIAMALQLQRWAVELEGTEAPPNPSLFDIEQMTRGVAAALGMDPERLTQQVKTELDKQQLLPEGQDPDDEVVEAAYSNLETERTERMEERR